MKKIIILVASVGENITLGNSVDITAKKLGFESEVVNIVDLKLPLYSSLEEKNGVPAKASELSKKLINVDSMVVVAPEYNGSIPPCLNNAIAWVSRTGDDWREAFNGKPTLIGTHSGGGGAHVLMAMRHQLSYVGANVLGRTLLTNYNKKLNIQSLENCLKQL